MYSEVLELKEIKKIDQGVYLLFNVTDLSTSTVKVLHM